MDDCFERPSLPLRGILGVSYTRLLEAVGRSVVQWINSTIGEDSELCEKKKGFAGVPCSRYSLQYKILERIDQIYR